MTTVVICLGCCGSMAGVALLCLGGAADALGGGCRFRSLNRPTFTVASSGSAISVTSSNSSPSSTGAGAGAGAVIWGGSVLAIGPGTGLVSGFSATWAMGGMAGCRRARTSSVGTARMRSRSCWASAGRCAGSIESTSCASFTSAGLNECDSVRRSSISIGASGLAPGERLPVKSSSKMMPSEYTSERGVASPWFHCSGAT